MHERSFIVLIDKDYDESLQRMALIAAEELFSVQAEYDASEDVSLGDDCVKKPRWVLVRGDRIERLDNAKEYLTACFTPESKCTELVCETLIQVLQDGYAWWWQSLECEFKVRIILPEGENIQIDPIMVRGHKMHEMIVQGNEVPVAYASSYLCELNSNFVSPPTIDDKCEEDEVRKNFSTALSEWKMFNHDLYSKCNVHVLKVLLKWFYFIKGVQPPKQEYVLNLQPKNDDSIIILAGDNDSMGMELELTVEDEIQTEESETETAQEGRASADAKRKISEVGIGSSSGAEETPAPAFFTKRPPQRSAKKFSSSKIEVVDIVSSSEDENATSKFAKELEEAIRRSMIQETIDAVETKGPWSNQTVTEQDQPNAAQASASTSITRNVVAPPRPAKSFSPHKIIGITQPMRNTTNRRKVEEITTTRLKPLSEVEFQMLRPVILDGSNIAMQHGTGARFGPYRLPIFSCRAMLIACRYFIARGHYVVAFVPEDRAKQHPDNTRRPMTDKHLLLWMIEKNLVCQTPAQRSYNSKQNYFVKCYDDLMLIQYADNHGGVIVSKDQFRDVLVQYPEWEGTIQHRRLMFSWIGDEFLVPNDPMGRGGIGLSNLLRFGPNEIAPTASRVMDERTCRELLHEIDEQLARPAPPVEPVVQQGHWNGNNHYSNNDRPYYNRQNNWAYNRQYRYPTEDDLAISASSEQELPPPIPARGDPPPAVPIQWNVFPTQNSGSGNAQMGSLNNGQASSSRSPPAHNHQYNGGHHLPQQFEETSTFRETARTTMVSQLSQVFDRATISRAIKLHPDVTDAQQMGALITDMMLAGGGDQDNNDPE